MENALVKCIILSMQLKLTDFLFLNTLATLKNLLNFLIIFFIFIYFEINYALILQLRNSFSQNILFDILN